MEVYVDIDEKGNVTVDVDHGIGPSCQKVLDGFDSIGELKDEGIKDEFYQKDSVLTGTLTNRVNR